MENAARTAATAVQYPTRTRIPHRAQVPDPDLSVPERGATGPVPIGQVMEPIQRIIEHPDRNRLMAEFFRRYWPDTLL